MKKFLGLSGLGTVVDEVKKYISSIDNKYNSHILNKSNPHKVTKEQIGLSNVENKSSATIRSELTKENVVDGLGYTPPTKDTVYTHPTYTAKTNGLYKVSVDSTGHVSTVTSVTKADITALGIPGRDTNTTYGVATQSANGLLSSTDKTKLDGIATGANKYVLPTASSSTLGGVKTTSQVTSASGYTACPIISGVPYYKDTNTTYSLGSFGITATAAELNYTDGVTSNIQTQLNGKAASSHTHSQYAASSHNHSNVLDVNGSNATTFAYSLSDFANPTYFAVWNGFQLRSIAKTSVCSVIGASPASHSHAWSAITGKPSTFAPSAHSHNVVQSSEPSGQNNGDLWFKTV